MSRIKPAPVCAIIALVLMLILSLDSLAHCQVSLSQASADRAVILGKPFSELKDELERSFPREEALENWASKTAAQYPSICYILVVNFENKLVHTFYREGARQHGLALQDAFRGINKFTMEEGVADQEVGGNRLLVTREKLVIEMDTYYFEMGFGPIR